MHKYLYSEIFYSGQKVHEYLHSKYFRIFRDYLYGLVTWNEPAIHFAIVQLVAPIDNHFFWCISGGSLHDLEAIAAKFVVQETDFVGSDAILFD